MVFCTVFSVVPQLMENAAVNPAALRGLGSLQEAVAANRPFSADLLQETIFSEGNTGITFIWMPQLFKTMKFGSFFMVLFFTALSLAAFTSLIAMVEVATRALLDAGVARTRAIKIVGVAGFLLGVPSALWMGVLDNQDWVWGVALGAIGAVFAVSVMVHGVTRFRQGT